MNVLDLFSGIGGFSLGLERAGMRTVAFCERDEFCRAVLAKHWPGVPCFEDIHAIDAGGLDRLGPIDLVCGGFPCQPFSIAGRQQAKADNRYLWPQMREVIALARPAWVIGENVAGIITLALDTVLADMESLGYTGRPFVIPACAVDARHRRDRVWIVARHAHHKGQSARTIDARCDELWDEPGRRSGSRGADQTEPRDDGQTWPMADSDSDERHGRSGPVQVGRSTVQREDSRDGRRQGAQWPAEPGVGRVAHGVPRRVDRLRTLGNAVVPQVVEEIGRAIMRAAA